MLKHEQRNGRKINLYTKLFIWLVLGVSIVSTLCADVSTKDFTFKLVPSQNRFKIGDIPGKFRLYDGKRKIYLKLKIVKSVSGKQHDRLVLAASGCKVTIDFTPRNKMILAETVITNTSDTDMWLEPGFRLTAPLTGEDYFFNGFDTLPVEKKTLKRLGLKGKSMKHVGGFGTPLSLGILIGKKKSISAGHVMFDPVSYNGTKVTLRKNGKCNLSFVQRCAIGPKRSVKIRFVLGVTDTRYGREEAAIQTLYDSFPEQWIPYVGQDNKYIWNAHAEYRAWTYKPNYEVERRFRSRWDWAYAPYKRCGDIYGHSELWNYKPLNYDFKITYPSKIAGGVFNYKTMTHDEFHRRRKEVFDKHGQRFGYAFYAGAAGTWCELDLARKKYPDSITEDRDGIVYIQQNGWVTGHDKEIRVFPMGTSFGKQLRKDLKLVYKELQMPGFSLDCAGCGAYYRGPASKNYDMPGRAWDNKGVFIDQSVAVMSLIDFIHKELAPDAPRSKRPFVAGNGSVKCDAVMVECTTFSPSFTNLMPQWRYVFGALPGVIHGKGYLTQEIIPEWRSLNTKQFLKRFTPLAIYEAFTEFRYGLSSTGQLYHGNALAQYALPELLECIRLGWQVQVPVDCDNGGKMLYRSRYGRGADTVLFFGNPFENPMPSKFAVGNDILGNDIYLFTRKMRDTASLKNIIGKGRTIFNDTLDPRVPVLYEAVCGLSNAPDGLKAEVSSNKDINRIVYTVKLQNPDAFECTVTPRAIRAFSPAQIKANGKATAPGETLKIPANAVLTLTYDSTQFKLPARQVLDFPFLSAEKKPKFTVRVPAKPSAAELEQAANFGEYFTFCAKHKLCAPGVVPVSKGNKASKGSEISLNFNAQDCGITREGDVISVMARNADEGEEMVRQLCYVMDRRFEYIFGFVGIDSFPNDMIDFLKIRGKSVPNPLVRCFEKGVTK